MIRTPPATDAYRDAWERVFGDETAIEPTITQSRYREGGHIAGCAAFATAIGGLCDCGPVRSHESDCPSRIGDPCRCPVGNL